MDLNADTPATENGIIFSIIDSTGGANTFRVGLYSTPIASDSFSLVNELNKLEHMSYLPLQSERHLKDGFRFVITYACVVDFNDKNRKDPNIFYIPLTHSHYRNEQPADAYISVSNYKKKDFGSHWRYDITFEMYLKLYYEDDGWREFGLLTDAVFNTRTFVAK